MAFETKGLTEANYESVMDSEENQPMGSTAGRSGAIPSAIDQGREVEVLWSCATETRGVFGE